MEQNHIIFVYGTLKKGFRLNDVLEHSIYKGEATLQNYMMFSLGAFPAISYNQNSTVYGEIYIVDNRTLNMLDGIESEGDLYSRIIVNVIANDILFKANTYVIKNKIFLNKNLTIPSGKWL